MHVCLVVENKCRERGCAWSGASPDHESVCHVKIPARVQFAPDCRKPARPWLIPPASEESSSSKACSPFDTAQTPASASAASGGRLSSAARTVELTETASVDRTREVPAANSLSLEAFD